MTAKGEAERLALCRCTDGMTVPNIVPHQHAENGEMLVLDAILSGFRRFLLYRTQDPTGISGTGCVAVGVMFADGTAVVRWQTEQRSTVVWEDASAVEKIHGHGGLTQIIYLDGPTIWE